MEVRPIDANALLEKMKHPLKYEKSESDTDIDVYMRIVENSPTLEYEPVVHCKDCGYWSGKEIYPGIRKCETRSFGYNIFTRGNDFCSYGAKMDEEMDKEVRAEIRILSKRSRRKNNIIS